MFFLKTQALIEWKEESFFSVQIFFDLKLFLDHFERSGLFRKVYEIAAPVTGIFFGPCHKFPEAQYWTDMAKKTRQQLKTKGMRRSKNRLD